MRHRLRPFALILLAAVTVAAPSVVLADDTTSQSKNKEDPMVVMHTNRGDIEIAVHEDKAPVTAENFLKYVRDGFYDGTIFHRVIPGFVIQGGGFTKDYDRKKTRDPIENESDNGLNNDRATLSMARTNDPDSATSQFFINLSDNPPLNAGRDRAGYAVFAEVTSGMDVVDEIADVPTGSAGPFRQDAPQQPVVIESAEIVAD
ncbi:peptidylprolyl isomerase [Salinisphaera orenii]|uniref:Peptidyl-prolyl cis-trans isomerase n=1 Tax=Salinisphaera orenii YIM 95161 TaxID=1051139 RepID=A0A423PEB9_9GAMM|nr:cyclophilin [Salinisphaera halophila YIM 95161]